MESESEFRFTAGALARKRMRHLLELEQFSGRRIRWMEEKYLFESVFHVRGPADDVRGTRSRIEAYAEALQSA